MLTDAMTSILNAMIDKAVSNERHFEIDKHTLHHVFKRSEDRFQVKFGVRFQVTHETRESEGIEWRYNYVELDFSSKGLFGGFNDDHYNSIFELVTEKVVELQLLKRAQSGLDNTRNEEVVLK